MSDLYTVDDVEALAESLRIDYDSEFDASHVSWQDFAPQARRLLNTVAPAIAARALREAADAYTWPSGGASKVRPWARRWLRERADEIDPTPQTSPGVASPSDPTPGDPHPST